MGAQLIDGRAAAAAFQERIAARVAALGRDGIVPGLAAILVGDDPPSEVYVANKTRAAHAAGIASLVHRLAADTQESALLNLIGALNADTRIDAILVQLPLPAQIDAGVILRAIDPAKDVDGFHPVNVGLAATGTGGILPCTPLGAMRLIRTARRELVGLEAVVIGTSNIVGKPMANLLLAAGCTVTVTHLGTRDVAAACRRADIVVAAAGHPGLVRGDWLKLGATVIDVGINRITGSDGRQRLVGDVAFEEAAAVAGHITPVPGGVGPMTIACLLANTVEAAERRARTGRANQVSEVPRSVAA